MHQLRKSARLHIHHVPHGSGISTVVEGINFPLIRHTHNLGRDEGKHIAELLCDVGNGYFFSVS